MFFRLYIDDNQSIYDINDNTFILSIDSYKFEGNKLSLTLSGDEDLVGTYYIDSYTELLELKEIINYGVLVEVNGTLEELKNNTVPNAFNYKKYLNNKGIYYKLDIDTIEVIDNDVGLINSLKNILIKRINAIDNTGYMNAFILGNKDDIDKDVYTSFQKIGITHLFALSGMHVGLLSGIILRLFKKISLIKKYIIVDILLIIYGFIVGFPSSIKRCILFFIFNSVNKIFKLEINSFKVLLLVVFGLVIYEYKIIYDVGFIYSITTVGGIILCNEFINHENKILSSFRLSLVAFIFSLPISLCNFYEVNLLSIFYNMVFVPYVSVIVYPLSLLSFIVPSLSYLFSLSIELLEFCSSYLSSFRLFNIYLDFNIFEVILFYLVTLIMFCKGKFILGFFLVLIVLVDILIPYLDSNAYVYFFDVGQGDSSLVISPYRKDVLLIDTGGVVSYVSEDWMKKDEYYVTDNVISFMKSIGIKTIDLLILSHGDSDHANEVENIVKDINVQCLNTNLGDINTIEVNSMELVDSCLYEPNNIVLKYLNYKDYGNENDNSLLTYINIYGKQILSFGDASKVVEEDVLDKYKLRNIDILKVGHHGSKTSSSKLFIETIKPKHSVISVGEKNRFGHPSSEVLEVLNESKIYRTDLDGTIMFKISKDEMVVSACPP